jgi:hypothetical protein
MGTRSGATPVSDATPPATPIAGATPGATPLPPEVPQLGIRPIEFAGDFFIVTLNPGERVDLAVELANFGSSMTCALTYAADVGTLINGGMDVQSADAPKSGATEWLEYPSETLVLEPRQTVRRSVGVSVPADTEPGQYTTALVVQTANSVSVAGSAGMRQILREAIAVAIEVPGPQQPALTVGDVSYRALPPLAYLRTALENTGNVRLKPAGELALATADGTPVTSAEIAMDTVFPDTETFIEVPLLQALVPGDYVVSLALADPTLGASVQADRPLSVAAEAAGTPVANPTISIASLVLNETRDDAGTLQFVEPVVTIENPGLPVSDAQLTLHVTRDGEAVEDFVLGSSLFLAAGPTEVRQRYFPPTGWESGTYAFEATLEAVDPNTEQMAVLATLEEPATIVVE